MRYTIEGFSQARLIEYGLDGTDALILRWFVDFLPRMAQVDHEEHSYYWVKYQQVIEDLPIIGITNREVMARRFNKLVDAGIMNKFINKTAGNFTTFRLTEKYITLVDYKIEAPIQKSASSFSKVDTPLDLEIDTKDSSIKETSLLNNIPPYIPHGEKAEGEVELVQKAEGEKAESLATQKPELKVVEQTAKHDHPFNNTPIPVDKMPLMSKHEFSDDARGMAYEAWLDVIQKNGVEFSEFELNAVKAYAFSKPNLPIHIIQSNVSLLEKWALEGLDIENSLRQSLSTRALIQPSLRREFDSQNNRIYDVKRLNAIRQNVIIKDQRNRFNQIEKGAA